MATKHKYITRMDYNNVHGYIVRWSVTGNWEKDTQSKLFSDGVYGSKRKALIAAKKFRNAKYKSLGKEELLDGRKPRKVRRHSRNVSGILGVRYNLHSRNITFYEEWSAFGYKFGKHWRKAFSINKHGERAAFLLACRARYRKQGELQIVCDLNELPFIPDVPYVLRGKK